MMMETRVTLKYIVLAIKIYETKKMYFVVWIANEGDALNWNEKLILANWTRLTKLANSIELNKVDE